jgi:hypothetical protein
MGEFLPRAEVTGSAGDLRSRCRDRRGDEEATMNGKKIICGGAGLAVTAAVAVPLLTGSASASGSQQFTVYAVHGSETFVDVGKKGFSAGDNDVNSSQLTQGGRTVGWETGSCLTTAVSNQADQICHFVLNLVGGQIVADGAVRSGQQGPGAFTLAIIGGTGSYRTAGGELHVTAGNGPKIPMTVNLAK